jgi:predicted Rossmann fold flavoprotein
MSSIYDVIVIGGGASGMMAAGRAAECGQRVLLVEKNKELGKKLSITGGGRCNILNAEPDTRTLLANYGEAAKFLHSPFSQHGMQDSWDFFQQRGLPIVVEARQRAFPECQSAPAVTKVMRRYCTDNNVELKLKTKVLGLLTETVDDVVRVTGIETNQGSFYGRSVILATGGSSHADTGASAEGVLWLREYGHTVYEPNPNLVPLVAEEDWVKALSGTTLSFMKITFADQHNTKATRFSRTGKILFTHFGVSGPLILNAAHQVKQLLQAGPVLASIDMYPDTEVGTLRNRVLEVFKRNSNKTLKNILKEFVPAGMTEAVAAQLTPELAETKVHSVSRDDRHALVDRLKAMPLTITGTMGLDWAVISDGGVDLSEVDTRTMASQKLAGLYLTGDTLHINRPSGGYSLQLCWTTGWVAGEHA